MPRIGIGDILGANGGSSGRRFDVGIANILKEIPARGQSFVTDSGGITDVAGADEPT